MPTETLTGIEAAILADRWNVDRRAVLTWLKARGFKSAMDLRAFGGSHTECMDKALNDFWQFST